MTQHLSRLIVLVFALFLSSASAFAQEAKVIKVKGQQAIVVFPNGMEPQVGQLLNIGDCEDKTQMANKGKNLSRAHSFSVLGELQLQTLSTSGGATNSSTSYNLFGLTGMYGWNQVQYEFGPKISLTYLGESAGSDTQYALGAYGDWNLVPNKSGNAFVYGIGASLQLAGDNNSTTGTSKSTSGYVIEGGGQVKWFPLGNNIAFRGDADLEYKNLSGSGITTTYVGLDVEAGITFYY